MANYDMKRLYQIFKRYLYRPGDEVILAGSAIEIGPLMKQKVLLHAQYHDRDAESPSYRIDKAIDGANRARCVVLERKRRILNDGSEDAELQVDVCAIANSVRSSNAVVQRALNSAYTNYPNFRLMKRSAEIEMAALLRAVDEAAATIEKDAREFKNVADATDLEKNYIETCRARCSKCLGDVKDRLLRQAKNVMQ